MSKRLKGLYTNCKPEDQPEGYYRDSLNITLDESLGAVVNELGTQQLIEVNNLVGHCVLPNGNIIFFEQGTTTDKITLYNGTTVTTIVEKNLGFGNTITAIPYLNEFGEYIIFWVDGINPARFINITNIEAFQDNIYYNLFPSTNKLPITTIENIFDTGGSLETGVYYFSAAYKHKDGTLTNFYDVAGPAYITNADPTESGQPGELTSKSINLSISNVDPQYESVQLAVIKKVNGIFDAVELLPELPTSVTTFTYTGNEAERPGALEEIQIDNAVYAKPKTIAYQDDNLYLGNVEEVENKEDFKALQQQVNNVVIKPDSTKVLRQGKTGEPNQESFSNVENATKFRGYRRGEIYAFYMSFIRNDGTETKAFHIPGRESTGLSASSAKGYIKFRTGLDETGGLKASSEPQTILERPKGNGVITITYGSEVQTVEVVANEAQTDVINIIAAGINNNPVMNLEIEAQVDGSELRIVAVNPGIAMNLKEVTIVGDAESTGFAYNVSEQAIRERAREEGDFFFFEDARFILEGGTDPFSNEIDITIDTDILTKTITIPNLTTGSTKDVLTDEVITALNADTDFALHFTASAQIIDGNRMIEISADAVGEASNGLLELDPKNTYLSIANVGAYSIISNLTGGFNSGVSERNIISPTSNDGLLSDLQDARYFRFRSNSAVNDTTGMGYWENANEVYPNDTDIWGSLAGTPVRHHHFPDLIADPFIIKEESTFKLKPMGFKVENVVLPEALKDEIVGYKVYYAKRTDENKRILDTVSPIPAYVASSTTPYRRDMISTFKGDLPGMKLFSNEAYYTHPFTYLKDKQNINNATHLAMFGSLNFIEEESNKRLHHFYDQEFGDEGYTNFRIDTSVFVDTSPTSSGGANLKGYGFERNLDNRYGESKLVLKLRTPDDPNYRSPLNDPSSYKLGNICSHKTDVYNSFDLQQLVYTGYQNTNKLADEITFEPSNVIYGGDTFITPYSFRIPRNATTQAAISNESFSKTNFLFTIFLESSDNINLRQRGDEFWENFYPAVSRRDMQNLAFRLNGDASRSADNDSFDITYVDNFLGYNKDYSAVNDIKFPGIYGKQERVRKSHPTRVIRNADNIRTFKQDDFLDLNKSRGEITKLSNYNNVLIPHMERALVRTRGKEELQVDGIRAFLGTGDIFSVRPDDIIYTDLGFAGLQDKRSAISTPFGYCFFDDQAKRMYSLTNEGIADISENILPDIRNFTNVELGYNPKDEVVVVKSDNNTYSYSPKRKAWISRHSYSPDYMLFDLQHLYSCSNNNLWKHSVDKPGKFYNEFFDSEYTYVKNDPQSNKAVSLLINTNTYLNYNNIITIEDSNFDYNNVNIEQGVNVANNIGLTIDKNYNSRLIAAVLSNEINRSLNAKSFSRDNKIYIFSDTSLNITHNLDTSTTGKISLTAEEGRELNKNATFDRFRITNSYQDTQLEDIEYFKDPIESDLENIYIGNARNVLKYWVINKFRDVSNIPEDIELENQWVYKRRMEDKYHLVQLIKDNKYNEQVYLFGSDIIDKTSIR